MSSSAIQYAHDNHAAFLEGLKKLLRIPSVSTLPEHKADCLRAATLLRDEMARIGLHNAWLQKTNGHPIVYADWVQLEDMPTVLIYGHYDVQPADPIDEWTTPPFEPTERDGNLYARGAADDKGQIWAQIKALESLLATGDGNLPVNVRIVLEGEEEVGGEGIAQFVATSPSELRADVALVSDTELFAPGLPTLCVGLRGMIYTEIEVRGARQDLHSGMYGGAAPNPFHALAHILAGLKDREGRVLIPGFYDDIVPPSAEELAAWSSLPFDPEQYRQSEIGSKALSGEPGYSVLERTWARPTLEVHGIPGGFTGDGAKTVIPARALAKVSMRLVPGMEPEKIFALYKAYVEQLAPADVEVEVRLISAGEPCLIPTDNRYIRSATQALEEVWGQKTVFVRSGGSIPIVGDFARHLKIPSVMMGFGLPDDNIHAPNEKFCIRNFELGVDSIIRFLEAVSVEAASRPEAQDKWRSRFTGEY